LIENSLFETICQLISKRRENVLPHIFAPLRSSNREEILTNVLSSGGDSNFHRRNKNPDPTNPEAFYIHQSKFRI
jgi:hypothetical protein